MLEPSAKRYLARSLVAGLLGWTLSLATFPTPGWAGETLPPSVRACSTLTDRDTRLACFDREVASFPDDSKAPSQTAKTQSNATAPTPPAKHGATAAARATPPPSAPAAAAASTGTAPPAATDKPGPISARVVGIDRSPDDMVLHLDNGQAWEQTQAIAGDLSLKVGDSVTIDKHFGSYWLNGPHVSGMKVRQKT
jgi:hypothetical protein